MPRTRLPMQEKRDQGLIPGSGRSPGEENANSLQYSYLKNPMDTGSQSEMSEVTEHACIIITVPYRLVSLS